MSSCFINWEFRYQRLMDEGHKYQLEGDFTGAESSYEKALQIVENHNDTEGLLSTLGYLGRVRQKLSKQDQAKLDFQRRVNIVKTIQVSTFWKKDAYYQLALFFLSNRQCSEAKEITAELMNIREEDSSIDFDETEKILIEMAKLQNCN